GVTPKLGVGIGLFAPYGLQTRWPLSFDGRFSGYDNILRSVYVQPTVSYQVTPWLSLGGGLDVVFGSVELNQRLDLADAPVPADLTVGARTIPAGCPIDALLTAPAASCGGIGLNLFNPSAGVFRSQPVTTTIKNPSQMALGVAYKVASGWTLLGDYQYTWWD